MGKKAVGKETIKEKEITLKILKAKIYATIKDKIQNNITIIGDAIGILPETCFIN
jgi:hypothetical protein